MAIAYNTSIVRSGLVLHLDAANRKSYPGSGTNWTDLSGLGNNGTITNGPTFDAGNNGSIVFDGANDLVNLGSTNNLTGNNLQTLTASVWVKYSATTSDMRSFTLTRGAGTTSSLFSISANATIVNNVTTPAVGAIGFLTRNNDNLAHSSLVVNESYHLKNRFIYVTGVIDGMNRYLYVDGVLKNSDSNIGMQSVTNNTDNAYAGTGPGGAGSGPWNGNISNVMYYKRALSATEVLQNFEAMRGRYGI